MIDYKEYLKENLNKSIACWIIGVESLKFNLFTSKKGASLFRAVKVPFSK